MHMLNILLFVTLYTRSRHFMKLTLQKGSKSAKTDAEELEVDDCQEIEDLRSGINTSNESILLVYHRPTQHTFHISLSCWYITDLHNTNFTLVYHAHRYTINQHNPAFNNACVGHVNQVKVKASLSFISFNSVTSYRLSSVSTLKHMSHICIQTTTPVSHLYPH